MWRGCGRPAGDRAGDCEEGAGTAWMEVAGGGAGRCAGDKWGERGGVNIFSFRMPVYEP
jgi:hypothetical protein